MTNHKLKIKALELLGDQGELLYLTRFGSHLYGTNTPTSDIDVKGIFLPKLENLILGEFPKSIHFSSGDPNGKNNHEDIDIELYSIQYFLRLLKNGETGALDLFFSHTNDDACIFISTNFLIIINNKDKLLESSELMKCAYVKYAIGQAKKYGIKGSRLGVLKKVSEFSKEFIITPVKEHKLHVIAHILLERFEDPSYFFKKEVNGIPCLIVCGKVHQYTTSCEEFFKRINKEYDKYGDRAKQAEKNEGIDWKALSHAVRAIFQMEELLHSGKIIFPFLKFEVDILKKIKAGRLPFNEVENLITSGLENLNKLFEVAKLEGKFDNEFVKSVLKSLYNL
jgi:hypothetical protein